MKVRMKTGLAGKGFSYQPKQEVEVSKEEGQRWIKAGIATEVKGKKRAASKPRTSTTTTESGE